MEDLQTDTLSDYGKNQNPDSSNLDLGKDNETACAATILNGCEEIDDPLDLMDNCDNASIGSNSDVWKGSDSEEESFDNRENPPASSETGSNLDPKPSEEMNEEPEPAVEPEEKEKQEDPVPDPVPTEGVDVIESETQKTTVTDGEAEESSKLNDNEALEKENTVAIEEQAASPDKNIEENNSPTVDNQGETKSVDNTEEKNENGNSENAELKDVSTDKEAEEVQMMEVDKDPLAADDGETDLLNSTEVTDKDPLNVDESDPLTVQSRRPDRHNDGQDDDDSQIDYNDDDDFDPSLLCPEVSMAVEESPVITNAGPVPHDGNSSPLPYEPVFSTFVDEVTGAEISFNLSPEEQELRKRLYGPTNPVQFTKIHCTACNVHLGSALEGQNNRFVHPMLKVLICKECYHFYTSGEFDKDEDGSELYCRWCGQGGQVLCCSKCEFVFCKRCIRTNFGRKKMFEIRDSDSWDCFRCSPGQLITQRIACYEFFEYVRREISRASSLNDTELWSKDHCRCCNNKKRKLEDGEEVKKPKKRRGDVDPDYNPIVDKPVVLPNSQLPSTSNVSSKPMTKPVSFASPKGGIILGKPVHVVPRYKLKDNDIEFVRHIPAPQVALSPIGKGGSMSTFRTILPSNIRPVLQPPSLVRINTQPLPPLLPTGRLLNNALQGRTMNAHPMKHEWFEKTVRAAARVNSHLSYTLTQLNKAQSQAASVEELAVVHNKLQEILSSSINSLIQIRKNLRTEFIAGIKTVRLPSKKVESFANDDDVIFVSAPATMPVPSTSQATAAPDPIVIVDNSNKPTVTPTNTSTTTANDAEKPKAYLKVKSVLELQNVPSECITIPDDTPLDTPAPKTDESSKETKKDEPEGGTTNQTEVVCNGASCSDSTRPKTPDPLSISPAKEDKTESPAKEDKTEEPKKSPEGDGKDTKKSPEGEGKDSRTNTPAPSEQGKDLRPRKSKELRSSKVGYNIKEEPSPEIKKMLAVKVNLTRVDLEELQKQLPNGCH